MKKKQKKKKRSKKVKKDEKRVKNKCCRVILTKFVKVDKRKNKEG